MSSTTRRGVFKEEAGRCQGYIGGTAPGGQRHCPPGFTETQGVWTKCVADTDGDGADA